MNASPAVFRDNFLFLLFAVDYMNITIKEKKNPQNIFLLFFF